MTGNDSRDGCEVRPTRFAVSPVSGARAFVDERPADGEIVQTWAGTISGDGNDGSTSTFGIMLEGEGILELEGSKHHLSQGCYFSFSGKFRITDGRGMLIHRRGYRAMTVVGGPVEPAGRLKYIDGCTDTLLIPPPRLGEACLNALYFPPGTLQTFHTHPSVRIGAVLWGNGYCDSQGEEFALTPGSVFYLPAEVSHRFRTESENFAVFAYHPDSDFGPRDDDHPMINRTMVDGVSAARIDEIRTA